jgi:hypothetical protein
MSRTVSSQEVGAEYISAFANGFVARNASKLQEGKLDFKERIILKHKSADDLVAQCTFAKKCKMSNLFPPCAFIGGCGVDDLNAGDSIIFEITAMGGQMAIQTNKISRKISTFETLFRSYKEALPADISKVKVCFVYNGADFVDVQQKFKSKLFETYVVHLPFRACLEWSIKEKANAAVKKAEAETRQAKAEAAAAAAAATEENQLLKRRLAELEGAQVVAADVSALEPTTKRIRLADTAHDSRRDGDATEISQRHHISGSRRAGGAGQSVSASARVNKHIYFD